MFRGEVWDAHFPAPIGLRPCLVLTTNALIPRLGAVTVAEITSTRGPASTHISIGADAGLNGRAESWVNVTGLHTIPKSKLHHRRGLLTTAELVQLSGAITAYLDIDLDE